MLLPIGYVDIIVKSDEDQIVPKNGGHRGNRNISLSELISTLREDHLLLPGSLINVDSSVVESDVTDDQEEVRMLVVDSHLMVRSKFLEGLRDSVVHLIG